MQRREGLPTYSSSLASSQGNSAATQEHLFWALLSCTVLLWHWEFAVALKDYGDMLQQAKKVTNKIQERKRSPETVDLTGEAPGIFLHMPQFSLVFLDSLIRKIMISCLLVLFFQRHWW